MDAKLVSVIVPTYNRSARVVEAIESVRRQTYSRWQLIVVDDGSDDDTAERVSGLDGVEFYGRPHRGQGATRNYGLSKVRGDYVASLDSDDTWDDDFLATSVRCLEAHDLDFVFADCRKEVAGRTVASDWERSGDWQKYRRDASGEWSLLGAAETRDLFLRTCPAPSSSLVIRRASIASPWNEELLITDDWCFVLDVVLSAPRRAAFTMRPLWTKRTDGTNIYDERERLHVVERLGVHDGELMAERFAPLLTRSESRFLRGRVAYYRLTAHWERFKLSRDWRELVSRDLLSAATNVTGMTQFVVPQIARRLRRRARDRSDAAKRTER